MNTSAIDLPSESLLQTLKERQEKKREYLRSVSKVYSGSRVRIASYMENIAFPELLNFDMNEFYSNPERAIEIELRKKIFWLDNSLDDDDAGDTDSIPMQASVGMYYDIELFGQQVCHDRNGVPHFRPHPIAENPDLSLIQPVDFHTSGSMPLLIGMYQQMNRISRERYAGRIVVGFPRFSRGPLDVYIQLRGYEHFVNDVAERPEFVHAFLEFISDQRVHWNRAQSRFLNQSDPHTATSIADDWVNVPFISPGIFRQFVIPAYRRIEKQEGTLKGFHTCGVMTPIVGEFLGAFPEIKALDISGWNDFDELDRQVDTGVHFHINFINTFVLTGSQQEHQERLQRIARIRKHREVSICAQAIVRLHDNLSEDLGRMNRFIELARQVLA